jgi:acetyl/propionyl-CoA carboxylase alpha subunit
LIFTARYRDEEIPLEVERHGSTYRVKVGERWIVADLITAGGLRSLRLEDGTQFLLAHHREGTMHQVTIGASRVDIEIVDPLALRRKRGDDHLGGTGLLVLEAMKMENEIPAPADGVVDEIFVKPGDTVEGGADLLHLRAL